jgi:hypothetical protein
MDLPTITFPDNAPWVPSDENIRSGGESLDEIKENISKERSRSLVVLDDMSIGSDVNNFIKEMGKHAHVSYIVVAYVQDVDSLRGLFDLTVDIVRIGSARVVWVDPDGKGQFLTGVDLGDVAITPAATMVKSAAKK